MQFTARNKRSVSSVHNETPNYKVQSRTNSGSLISFWMLGVFLSILHTSETTNEKDRRKAETREAPRNLPCFFAQLSKLEQWQHIYIYICIYIYIYMSTGPRSRGTILGIWASKCIQHSLTWWLEMLHRPRRCGPGVGNENNVWGLVPVSILNIVSPNQDLLSLLEHN